MKKLISALTIAAFTAAVGPLAYAQQPVSGVPSVAAAETTKTDRPAKKAKKAKKARKATKKAAPKGDKKGTAGAKKE